MTFWWTVLAVVTGEFIYTFTSAFIATILPKPRQPTDRIPPETYTARPYRRSPHNPPH